MYNNMIIKCKHWKDCGVRKGGCCAIEEYPTPSFGVCLNQCKKNTNKPDQKTINKILHKTYKKDKRKAIRNKSRGLGDTIKRAIDKVTMGKVKPCGGCKKRQEALNKLLPYKGDKDGRLYVDR